MRHAQLRRCSTTRTRLRSSPKLRPAVNLEATGCRVSLTPVRTDRVASTSVVVQSADDPASPPPEGTAGHTDGAKATKDKHEPAPFVNGEVNHTGSAGLGLTTPPRAVVRRAKTISVGITSSNRSALMRGQHMMASLREFYAPPATGQSDGNESVSEREMLMRESLRFDKRVLHALHDVWSFLETQYGPELRRQHYFDLQARAYASLVDDFDVSKAAKILRDDWVGDSHGRDAMDFGLFARSWFQIADRWTDEIDAVTYTDFILSLFNVIAPVGVDGLRRFADSAFYGGHDGRLPDGRHAGATRESQRERDRQHMLGLRRHGEVLVGGFWKDRMQRFRDGRAAVQLANFRRASQLLLINTGLDDHAFRKSLNEVALEREQDGRFHCGADDSDGKEEEEPKTFDPSPILRLDSGSTGELRVIGKPQRFLTWRHAYVLDPAIEGSVGASEAANVKSRRLVAKRGSLDTSSTQHSRSALVHKIAQYRRVGSPGGTGGKGGSPACTSLGRKEMRRRRRRVRSNHRATTLLERPRTAVGRLQGGVRSATDTHSSAVAALVHRPATAGRRAATGTSVVSVGGEVSLLPSSATLSGWLSMPMSQDIVLGEAITGQVPDALGVWHGMKPRERTLRARRCNATPPTLTSRVMLSGYKKRPIDLTRGRPWSADGAAPVVPRLSGADHALLTEDSIPGPDPPIESHKFALFGSEQGEREIHGCRLGLRDKWEVRARGEGLPKSQQTSPAATTKMAPIAAVHNGCSKLRKHLNKHVRSESEDARTYVHVP